jgi:hypothetical protein
MAAKRRKWRKNQSDDRRFFFALSEPFCGNRFVGLP